MIDAWFWPYLLRIVLLTAVMVGLIYAVFFALKYNKQFQNLAQGVNGGSATGVPSGSPSPFIQWCLQRFGLSSPVSFSQGVAAPPSAAMVPALTAPTPAPSTPAPLTQLAAEPMADAVDGAIQFSGPYSLGVNQQVSVLTVDGQRHILVATPQGVFTLASLPLGTLVQGDAHHG